MKIRVLNFRYQRQGTGTNYYKPKAWVQRKIIEYDMKPEAVKFLEHWRDNSKLQHTS